MKPFDISSFGLLACAGNVVSRKPITTTEMSDELCRLC